MRALHRKLLRDLWQIKGQGLAIALVIGAGIAMYVMYLSTFHSLRLTQETYYDRYRFAEVFANCKRAPQWLATRIAEIPGVERVETRVVAQVTLDVEGMSEPVVGRLISIPPTDQATLNDVVILRGRYPDGRRADEVLVNEGFALAHEFGPGDQVAALINGRRRKLEIVGVALSPEHVYNIRPGELVPDDGRFGIFWMPRRGLATAFDMEGGFNDVLLTLAAGASEEDVIARLDHLLERYGGLSAYPRALQESHWYLEAELTGLQAVGWMMPMIFLAVAAFLLNVVLTRIISVQRGQIAALKALGYSNREIGMHYVQWALAIALVGGVVGVAGGARLGLGMVRLYNDWFRFPFLSYEVPPKVLVGALAIALVSAVLGAAGAVRRAVILPPAEAMHPEPPGRYQESLLERIGLKGWLGQPTRMILRNIQRRPGRAAATVVGVAFAVALGIVGMFFLDSMEEMLEVQFRVGQRQDVTLTFVEPASPGAFFELLRMPGVLAAEPMRAVPVRIVHGHRSRRTAITGLVDGARLQRVVNTSYDAVPLPPEGLVLSKKLAEILGAARGDTVTLEVLEGRRPTRLVVVVDLVDELMGVGAYMEVDALRRLMREGGVLSGAVLAIDSNASDAIYRRLKAIPMVAGVALKAAAIASFRTAMDQSIGVMIFFNVLFAGTIAFGVVYNAARIALSERSRELASLRVLGFTRAEISYILLGELAALVLGAIPVGFVLGYGLAGMISDLYDTELYRFPLVIWPRTYAFGAATVLVSAVISGWLVRRKLHRLDLVEVLKSRE